MGSPRQAVNPEELLAVGEHAEEPILVKEAVNDVIVANRVVQDVPEAVFEVLECLL